MRERERERESERETQRKTERFPATLENEKVVVKSLREVRADNVDEHGTNQFGLSGVPPSLSRESRPKMIQGDPR